MKTISSVLGIFLFFSLISCSDKERNIDLSGKWVDTESFGLQFIEFYSKSQGRIGHYGKNFERYDDFNYRLFDNKIAIDFVGDSEGETIHDLILIDNERIEISGITDIPENPNKKYQRYKIKTDKENNVVILGIDDIYFDFESGNRLQGSQIDESRCPKDVECIWQGYAAARFDLIVNGNTQHIFDLATIDLSPDLKKDTLINETTYRLLDITPYPELDKEFKIEDYKVMVSIEN